LKRRAEATNSTDPLTINTCTNSTFPLSLALSLSAFVETEKIRDKGTGKLPLYNLFKN
jgi:hypothetical protein